jgi:hypothetical protein
MKKLRGNLFRIFLPLVGLCLLIVIALSFSGQETEAGPQGETGKLEKMIVASGEVELSIDLDRLNGKRSRSQETTLRFESAKNEFFTIMVFNDELRAALPSSMNLVPQDTAAVPTRMAASFKQLVLESTPFGSDYELMIRDGRTGFTFFNIEGHQFEYQGEGNVLTLKEGRLLISKEFAAELGRPEDGGKVIGKISGSNTMRAIEVQYIDNGEMTSSVLPAGTGADPQAGTVPGPDVVVGDVIGLAQFGSAAGTQVGLAVGTDSCNFGTVDLDWFANPSNNHPVIPQNLYRMSGGPNNDERFEQIGQSQVKHAFTALTQNLCNLGCNGVGGSRLGSGCSDPYSASLNAGPSLGSKAWINPFTGFYPRNDSATPNNSHSGHTHLGPTHRILTEISDLSTTQNPGATYYAEAQYVTPHEYVWCQANPTQCNMNNNVSYRRYSVNGTGSPFSFSAVGSTQRAKTAITAWTGATTVEIRPDAVNDGIAVIGYKVTNPSPGVWHYEYAIYNQNLDRAVRSFSLPLGNGITLSNVGFRFPPQHPGSPMDGTVGSAGFSSAPWTQTQTGSEMTWATETLAQNPNANAIRWGTMYNFRFDSNRPPQAANATIGFFKTGSPMNVLVQAPSPVAAANVSVSGRVTTAGGQGIGFIGIFMIDGGGVTRTALSNPFGYYSFNNIPTGSYTVGASSKRYSFPAPTVMQISNDLSDLNFVAEP